MLGLDISFYAMGNVKEDIVLGKQMAAAAAAEKRAASSRSSLFTPGGGDARVRRGTAGPEAGTSIHHEMERVKAGLSVTRMCSCEYHPLVHVDFL